MTKSKNLVEQMLEDFTKIVQVQQSVLLQRDFVTSDDGKTMILSMKLDYLDETQQIPISKLKELIMLLKLKTGKNVNISFNEEFIEINDNDLKTIYRYSDEVLIMHINAIHEKKMIKRLNKPENYIKVNLTAEDQLTIKKAIGVFTEPLLAVKKSGDFLRFIIFDKTKPEKCLLEALSLPIEKSCLKDFDIALMDKNNFIAIHQTDYNLYICRDYNGEREFIKFLLDGEIMYSISSVEPLVENFDIVKFNKFIDKFLNKNSDVKKIKNFEEDEKSKNNISEKLVETEEEIKKPMSLDDINIDDFEDLDI